MRSLVLAFLLVFASASSQAATPAFVDDRPGDDEAGPAGIACIYPLESEGADVCKFMVHVAPEDGQEYGTLVLLRDSGKGIMKRVDTVDVRPWVKPNQHLVFGDCGLEGGVNPSLIGLVEGYDHEAVPLKLWSVDFDNAKFIESAVPAGLVCLQGSGD